MPTVVVNVIVEHLILKVLQVMWCDINMPLLGIINFVVKHVESSFEHLELSIFDAALVLMSVRLDRVIGVLWLCENRIW